MFSEAVEEAEEKRAALEREREEVAMSLDGARERVAKYKRTKRRSRLKVGGARVQIWARWIPLHVVGTQRQEDAKPAAEK